MAANTPVVEIKRATVEAVLKGILDLLWPGLTVEGEADKANLERYVFGAEALMRKLESMGWVKIAGGRERWDPDVPKTPEEAAAGAERIREMSRTGKMPAIHGTDFATRVSHQYMVTLGLDPTNEKHRHVAEAIISSPEKLKQVLAVKGLEEVSASEARNMGGAQSGVPTRAQYEDMARQELINTVLPHMERTGQIDSAGNVVADPNTPPVPLPRAPRPPAAPLNGTHRNRLTQQGLDPVAGIPLSRMPDPDADPQTPDIRPKPRNAAEEAELRQMEREASAGISDIEHVRGDITSTWFNQALAQAQARSAV